MIGFAICPDCETFYVNPESDTCDCGGKLA